jgi:hypothetical protein
MQSPYFQNIDEVYLKYKVDFRDIYSTVLDKWLQTDSMAVLRESLRVWGLYN